MDLPGIKPSDMNIEFVDDANVLRVYGSRKLASKDDKTVSEAHFEKRFTVGTDVKLDEITANLSDGVLTLVVPKTEVKETRVVKIPITEGPVENNHHEVLESRTGEEEHKEEDEHPKAA